MAEKIVPISTSTVSPPAAKFDSGPTVDNDGVDTAGVGIKFAVSDLYHNTLTNIVWTCHSNSTGAAAWRKAYTYNHASNHTDGTDDIQGATNTQDGLATASHITAVEASTEHESSTGADHGYIDQSVTSGSSPTFNGTNFSNITATDANAIHDNVSAEISVIGAKGSPVSADLLIIEDSEASNAKKSVQIGNLPSSTAAKTYQDFTPQGSAPSVTEGRLWYDSVEDALEYYLSSSLRQHLGRDFIVRVHNGAGATLSKGTIVKTIGASGGMPSVSKAQADTAANCNAVGSILADISAGGTGFMIFIGDQAGLNTSSYSAGDFLYLSSSVAGGLTATQPANLITFCGEVLAVDASDGIIGFHFQPPKGAGSIDLPPAMFLNTSTSGGTTSFTYSSVDKWVSVYHTSTSNNSWHLGSTICQFELPTDFISFPSNAFTARVRRSYTTSGQYIRAGAYVGGVADSTIDNSATGDITPSVINTWEDQTLSFGSTYSPGDTVYLQVDLYDYDTTSYSYSSGIQISYNKI